MNMKKGLKNITKYIAVGYIVAIVVLNRSHSFFNKMRNRSASYPINHVEVVGDAEVYEYSETYSMEETFSKEIVLEEKNLTITEYIYFEEPANHLMLDVYVEDGMANIRILDDNDSVLKEMKNISSDATFKIDLLDYETNGKTFKIEMTNSSDNSDEFNGSIQGVITYW